MREIKFRGKLINSDQWQFGSYISNNGYDCDHIYYGGKCYDIDPETVGQYTGLKDRNGVEIYEGDIIKEFESSKYNKLVLFNESTASFAMKSVYGSFFPLYNTEEKEYLVIGNIHDNPELIKEEEK